MLRTITPLALALVATSCDGGAPTHGVLHLDPRLADGRSPADALAADPRSGFAMGDEPLRRELDDRGSGDAGLVAIGLDARRTWPSDWDVPLVTREVLVPRGGRFVAAVALADPDDDATSALAVVEVSTGGGWRALVSVVPRADAWTPVVADLARYGGDTVRLRLVASRHGDDPASLERAAVLWAAPRVTGEPPSDRRPDVVLVTLDTTRADAVGEAGSRTPFLDRLAERGVRFTRAFAATNSTQPSHASLLTGMAMQDHGVADNYSLVPPEVTTVAERLRAAGYFTFAAVSQPCVGLGCGFGQGFDAFAQPGPRAHLDGRGTALAVERALGELLEEPLFLWLHLYDPHTPYVPPRDFLDAYLAEHGLELPPRERDPATMPVLDVVPPDMEFLLGTTNLEHARFLYAAGVSYADVLVGRVARAFEKAGRGDDAAWIVTADHGESLGEHGSWFNHRGLFRETTHVPLIVVLPASSAPSGFAPGGTVGAPVSAVDVAPTLLDVAGVAAPPGLTRGTSLLRLAPDARRWVWFEHANRHQVGGTDGRTYFVTTRSDDMTFGLEVERDADGRRVPVLPDVPRGTSFLFDLEADRALEHDLAAERPERVAELLERLDAWQASAVALDGLERDMTPEEAAALEKLGYADQRE